MGTSVPPPTKSRSRLRVRRDVPVAAATRKHQRAVLGRDLMSGAAKGAVTPRPTPAQMQRVPRGFRDSLPLRSAALKDRTVAPKATPPPGYAEFREWLLVEAPLRKTFTRRFVERTRDPAFRAGLVEHLSQHPEWEPVLFPERFVKPASAPR